MRLCMLSSCVPGGRIPALVGGPGRGGDAGDGATGGHTRNTRISRVSSSGFSSFLPLACSTRWTALSMRPVRSSKPAIRLPQFGDQTLDFCVKHPPHSTRSLGHDISPKLRKHVLDDLLRAWRRGLGNRAGAQATASCSIGAPGAPSPSDPDPRRDDREALRTRSLDPPLSVRARHLACDEAAVPRMRTNRNTLVGQDWRSVETGRQP